ncbi:MAG: hypothetical protein AAFN81_25515 [Bacteroidota bacterium]
MPLLFELLRGLSHSELRMLKKYVRSPFVTHREELALLCELLVQSCYEKQAFPAKEELYVLVFGHSLYNDQRLRSLMSDLHLRIEDYLRWLSSENRRPIADIHLTALYRKRGLNRHFQRTSRKVNRQLEESTIRNADYYQQQLLFQIETNRFQTTNKRTGKLNLQEIGDTMDTLYLAQKLRHVCSQLSHRAVYQTDYQFGLLAQWIDEIEDSPYLTIPAIALYYYCYRFLTEAYSQEYFRKFREQLRQHYQQFPQDELKDLYRAAINFCIRKLNGGSLDFTREGWELYQDGLSQQLFLENQQLSRFTFDNIVGFGLRLEDFGPVVDFIENYQQYLAPAYRESAVHFNYARLEYSRRNYTQALTHLQHAKPKDLVNQLILKTIQLKIYFEADEISLLESHLDSFRHFIRRREVSDYHRTNFSNIITYTRKLISLAPSMREQRQRLGSLIEAEPILSEKEWLLSKVDLTK